MSMKNIYSAIKTQLSSTDLGFDIVWPNTSYEAETDQPYIEVYFIPASPEAAEIGHSEYLSGITQLNAYTPSEQGDGAMMDLVDSIRSLFGIGSTISYDDARVRIDSCGPVGSPSNEDGWFMQQIDIYWSDYQIV